MDTLSFCKVAKSEGWVARSLARGLPLGAGMMKRTTLTTSANAACLAALFSLQASAQPAGSPDGSPRPFPKNADNGPAWTAPPSRHDVPSYDLTAGAYAGLFGGYVGGIEGGASAQVRIGLLQIGAFGEYGGAIATQTGVGGTGGIGWRSESGFRLAALASFGWHEYSGVGTALLGSDPGISGGAPFAGGRTSISYLFGRGPTHLEIGLLGFWENDLLRRTEQVHYTETGLFSGESYEKESEHTLGGWRGGAALQVSMTHDMY